MLGFSCRVVPFGPLLLVLLLLPKRVSVSLVTPQEPYGIFCDSQGVTSLQSCLSREALPFQTRDGSLLLSPRGLPVGSDQTLETLPALPGP